MVRMETIKSTIPQGAVETVKAPILVVKEENKRKAMGAV